MTGSDRSNPILAIGARHGRFPSQRPDSPRASSCRHPAAGVCQPAVGVWIGVWRRGGRRGGSGLGHDSDMQSMACMAANTNQTARVRGAGPAEGSLPNRCGGGLLFVLFPVCSARSQLLCTQSVNVNSTSRQVRRGGASCHWEHSMRGSRQQRPHAAAMQTVGRGWLRTPPGDADRCHSRESPSLGSGTALGQRMRGAFSRSAPRRGRPDGSL